MAAHVPSEKKKTESRHWTSNRKTVARYPYWDHSARNSAEAKSLYLHSETRSTSQACAAANLQWSRIIECMETYSVDLHDQLLFFLHDSPKSMRAIDEKQRKRTTWPYRLSYGLSKLKNQDALKNSTKRGAFFRHFWVSKVITIAHAYKSGIIFHIFPWPFKKKKLISYDQRWLKVASRGPALKCVHTGGKKGLAPNPGPHHHRIYDRREEGLGKPPFGFVSLPTIVGKISTQNSEPRVPFSSLLLTAKNVEVSPGAGWACQGTNTRRSPASTCLKKAQRKVTGRRPFGSEIVDSLAWNLQSALNEMFFLPFFLVPLIFFVAHFPVGENTSLLPCGSNTAQGASGKRGPDLLALFERRDVYPRQTMRQLRKVCHAEGCSTCHYGNKPSNCRRSFPARCWSGRLPQPGKGEVSSS